jgi:AcrR family transcriptional regulator
MAARKTRPTKLELLWDDVEQGSRGPKPSLSVDVIARTAIAIADAEGFDALSMERVARELGYTTMSLYRYVPSKEHLVEVMVDRAIGPPPPPPGEAVDWRTELEDWVRGVWDMNVRHPWTLRVEISGPPVGPNQLAWFDAALRPLARAGLGPGDMISAAIFLAGVVRELARISVEQRAARAEAGVSATEVEAGFATVLRTYVDAERFPTLWALANDRVFDPAEPADDDTLEFDLTFGVRRLLDGIQAYVTRPDA